MTPATAERGRAREPACAPSGCYLSVEIADHVARPLANTAKDVQRAHRSGRRLRQSVALDCGAALSLTETSIEVPVPKCYATGAASRLQKLFVMPTYSKSIRMTSGVRAMILVVSAGLEGKAGALINRAA